MAVVGAGLTVAACMESWGELTPTLPSGADCCNSGLLRTGTWECMRIIRLYLLLPMLRLLLMLLLLMPLLLMLPLPTLLLTMLMLTMLMLLRLLLTMPMLLRLPPPQTPSLLPLGAEGTTGTVPGPTKAHPWL